MALPSVLLRKDCAAAALIKLAYPPLSEGVSGSARFCIDFAGIAPPFALVRLPAALLSPASSVAAAVLFTSEPVRISLINSAILV